MQGIRNELFSNNSYSAVSVDDIKQQFPAQTDLQLYWPNRSSLDPSSNGASNSSGTSISMWIQKPSGTPPPLPVNNNTQTVAIQPSSVIQKNPAVLTATATGASTRSLQPSTSAVSTLLQSSTMAQSRTAINPPTCTNSALYNGWTAINSYTPIQQVVSCQTSFVFEFLQLKKETITFLLFLLSNAAAAAATNPST